MRTIYRAVYGMCALLAITACDPAPKTEVKNPNFREMMKDYVTCENKASEIQISDAALQNRFSIQDKIESQKFENIDCDGNVTGHGYGPTKSLMSAVNIDLHPNLSEKLNFVRVESATTCSVQAFDAKENTSETDKKPAAFSSEAYENGSFLLFVSDSTLKIPSLFLNVVEGKNPIKITYFGKCLKYKDKLDPSLKGDAFNCLEAETLGTQEALIEVDVDRPGIEGVRKVDTCIRR